MRVGFIATGGTISSTFSMMEGGAVPSLSSRDLLLNIEKFIKDMKIEVSPIVDFSKVPGTSLSLEDLLELSKAVKRMAQDEDVEGIVITMGTPAIEEASYFLDITYDLDKPVIVTGAMRNPSLPGTDAWMNLTDSILVASSRRLNGFGVVVVMGSEIHSARDVVKTNTISVSAFKSPNWGPLGYVYGNDVHLISKTNFLRERIHLNPNSLIKEDVLVLKSVLGMRQELIEDILFKTNNTGIVLEIAGGGRVNKQLLDPIERYIRETSKPVVVASRLRTGPLMRTYGGKESILYLERKGAILANFLTPEKARMKLILALSSKYSGKLNDFFYP